MGIKYVGFFLVGFEADNAVWKSSLKSQNAGLRNIGSNRDT